MEHVERTYVNEPPNASGTGRRTTSGRRGRGTLPALAGAIALLACGSAADAQYTGDLKLFFDTYSMKDYALAPVDEHDPSRGYVAAATAWYDSQPPWSNSTSVHWVYVDGAGNVVDSRIFDDPDYEEKVVGMHVLSDGTNVIVVNRVSTTQWGLPHSIAVLKVAANGAPISTRIIESNDPNLPSMFPLGTLMNGDQLLICGYIGAAQGDIPPDLMCNKSAFILDYDLWNERVTAMHEFETGSQSGYDFDIASHMKMIRDGIWVGGSTNDPQGTMMNVVVDASNLSPLFDHPFSLPQTPSSSIEFFWETSFDCVEKVYGETVVFGNTYRVSSGFASPEVVHVTMLDADYRPLQGNCRALLSPVDYTWGNVVLAGPMDGSNGNWDDGTVMLCGYGMNRPCGNFNYPRTEYRNVDPFLSKMTIKRNGNDIDVQNERWNTLRARGTGDVKIGDVYAYSHLGALNSIAYSPICAVRERGTDDIILAAPTWNNLINPGMLNMKFIRAESVTGAQHNCDGTEFCDHNPPIMSVTLGAQMNDQAGNVRESWTNDGDMSLPPDLVSACVQPRMSVAPTPAGTTNAITLTPNPANEQITIVPTEAWAADEEITVVLTDLTGRQLTGLYRGSPAGLAAIPLPELASGMYLVRIDKADAHVDTRILMIER